jgi:hypothetical protein
VCLNDSTTINQEDGVSNNRSEKSRNSKTDRTMVRGLLVALVALAIAGIAAAQENTDLIFRGAIEKRFS